MSKLSKYIAGVVFLCSLSGYSVSQEAAVEQASGNVLEEIIVTAQKRSQSVQDIPVAIDAFSGDQIADRGVSDLEDLTHISTSFGINNGAGSAQLFIRGLGSNILGSGSYGSAAVYVDGSYIPRGYSLAAGAGELGFVDSLQVLKGPQGSLYGRNATAGALVITTRNPSIGEEFNGSAKATMGDYGVRKYSLELGGGITDSLAGSFAYSQSEGDGFIENLGGGRDFDDQDGFQIRGKLLFAPTDDIELVFSAIYNEDLQSTLGFQQVGHYDTEIADAAFGPIGLNNPQALWAGTILGAFFPAFGLDPTDPALAGQVIGGAFGLRFPDKVGATFDNNTSDQSQGIISDGGKIEDISSGGYYEDTFLTLNGRFSFDAMDLVTITSYNDHFDTTTAEIFRVDPSSVPDLSGISPAFGFLNLASLGFSGVFPSEAISQEVYLVSTESPIEWIAGVYYFNEDGTTHLSAGAFEADAHIAENNWEVESVSIFGEVNIPFGDQWVATIGGRFTDEEYTLDDMFDANLAMPGLQGNVGSLSRTDNQITYTAKLAFYAESWMFYGGVNTGFKGGSLNTNNPSAGQVDPEEVTSIEFGFKSELLEGRARLNGSVFSYDYDNIQLTLLEPSTNVTFLVDGTQAEILGIELSLDALVGERTSVLASATYLDHEYTSDAMIPGSPQPLLIDGNDMVQASDLAAAVAIEHVFALALGGEVVASASANYNSGFWIDQTNTFGSGGDEDDGFTTVNANIKYVADNDRWSVALFANNLTDEEYFRGGTAAAGGLAQVAIAGRPLHWGVTGEFNF